MLQHIAEEILKLFELMDPLLSCVQSTDIFITSIHHLYCSVSDLQHFLFFKFILFLNLKHCISFAKHQNESATAFPFDCLYKCSLSAHMTHLFLHVVYFLYQIPYQINHQIRSVAQSSPTLCDPMNCSTLGLPVHYQLPEFTQTPVHRVSDAIQPSHPLSSPSPLAPNPSQHQSLFQ